MIEPMDSESKRRLLKGPQCSVPAQIISLLPAIDPVTIKIESLQILTVPIILSLIVREFQL